MAIINENTLRDGSYAVDFKITTKQTEDVVRALDNCGFSIIEIGHGLGLGAYRDPKMSSQSDEVIIESAIKSRRNSKLSVFFIPNIGSNADIKTASDMGIDLIRIGVNIDQYEQTREYAEYAKSLGLMVAVNCMKSYAVNSYEYSKITQDIDSWGLADVIYLVDSAGCMTPNEVNEYITKSIQSISTPLGFHGHNNLSLASINSIEAIKSGATYIDTCIKGMGRSAGNAQTEIAVILLQKIGLYNHIDIYDLYNIANDIVLPIMNRHQGLASDEIHIGLSKFHSSYLPFVEKSSSLYNVDQKKLIKEASDVNCLNPTQELFNRIASQLKDGQ